MKEIIEINDKDFKKMVVENSIKMPVLLKFWANWCNPCKKMNPILEKISIDYEGKIQIFSINVENNQITTTKFNIRSIPSLLFFFNKNLVHQHSGFLNDMKIKELIKSNFDV